MQPDAQSELSFSVQHDDYRTELAVLRRLHRGAPLRVLMVASSGENALSLMANDVVGDVHAADTNAAQVHLAELRRTALRHLDRNEQLRLFGSDPAAQGSAGAAARIALYDRVAEHLPRAAQAYWNERREREIASGLHDAGRNDVMMRDIRASLGRHGFRPLVKPLNGNELPAWQLAYAEVMNPDYLRETLGFPDEAAARLASQAAPVSALHFQALLKRDAKFNPFVTTALEGRYSDAAGEEGLPLYLQYDGQDALRRLGTRERLKLHIGSIVDLAKPLATKSGGFDLISIANLADWMDGDQLSAAAAALRDSLSPGGALLARTVREAGMLAEAIGRHLAVDAAFNDELAQVERGPWFRTVAAGFRS